MLEIGCGIGTGQQIIAAVEKWVYNSLDSKVTSKEIGEKVMSELKKVDQVAYVRFASVSSSNCRKLRPL